MSRDLLFATKSRNSIFFQKKYRCCPLPLEMVRPSEPNSCVILAIHIKNFIKTIMSSEISDNGHKMSIYPINWLATENFLLIV